MSQAGEVARSGGGLAPVRVGGLTLGFVLAIVGAALVGAGPVLYRGGIVDFEVATAGLQHWAMLVFAGGVVLALIALIAAIASRRHRSAILGVLLLVATGAGAGTLYSQSIMRTELPPTYDAQTDWGRPVAFTSKALEAREAAGAVRIRDDAMIPPNAGKFAGKSFAEAQGEVYDLKPLIVGASPADAVVAATKAAERLGWLIMLSDPPGGQLEAVHHSFWYGLTSDIAVRVTQEGSGARIDVRSTSRLAHPDMGANASRVKQLLDDVAFALR